MIGITSYIKELIKLSLPIILGNLGIMLISVGDVYVAARYSTDTLAATSIANAILFTIFLLFSKSPMMLLQMLLKRI